MDMDGTDTSALVLAGMRGKKDNLSKRCWKQHYANREKTLAWKKAIS